MCFPCFIFVPKVKPVSSNIGQCWPFLGQVWPTSDLLRPILVETGQTWVTLGPNRPLHQHRPIWTEFGQALRRPQADPPPFCAWPSELTSRSLAGPTRRWPCKARRRTRVRRSRSLSEVLRSSGGARPRRLQTFEIRLRLGKCCPRHRFRGASLSVAGPDLADVWATRR